MCVSTGLRLRSRIAVPYLGRSESISSVPGDSPRTQGFNRRCARFCGDAAMTQPAKAQEPSMEEILASIRRIIADDDAVKSPPSAAEPSVPPPPNPQLPAANAQSSALLRPAPPPAPPSGPILREDESA